MTNATPVPPAHTPPLAHAAGASQAASRLVAVALALHVLLWTLVPAWLYRCLPHDTLEGITWGRMWQWGYDKHPPLAAWISAAFTDGLGVVGWPMFLASSLAVTACLWAVWRLARDLLEPRQAVAAVLLLEAVYYFNIGSLTFNPNIVMLPTWAWLALSFKRVTDRPTSHWRWAVLGLWVGLSLLAKYQSGLLILLLLATLIAHPAWRGVLMHRGFFVAAAVSLLVMLPNLLWLQAHDFLPLHYMSGNLALEEDWNTASHSHHEAQRRWGWLSFLVEQMLAAAPLLLVYLISFGWRRGAGPDGAGRRTDQFLLTCLALGPLLVTAMAAAAMQVSLVARWGFPYLIWWGVALVYWRRPQVSRAALTRLLACVAALHLMLTVAQYWIVDVRPFKTGKPAFSITAPARVLAERVSASWRAAYGQPLAWVVGDRWVIAGVCAYSADKPRPVFDWQPARNPWFDAADMAVHGAAIVLRLPAQPGHDEAALAIVRRQYPQLSHEQILTLPELTAAPVPVHRYWVAFLAPQRP